MARVSGGLLLHRYADGARQVLLGHMGGPLWARKDEAAWSIPKGELDPEEEPLAAAEREFAEELGIPAPAGARVPLGSVRQSGGKTVVVWAVAADLDLAGFTPGTFTMTWPPRSDQQAEFPELDRVAWLDVATAAVKLVKGQRAFLDRLAELD